MQTGTLRIELRTGGALPVNNATVRIKSTSGEILYDTVIPLLSAGETAVFELEVPDYALSLNENERLIPYGLFNVEVLSGNFVSEFINGVQVFPDRESLLIVSLLPQSDSFPQAIGPQRINIPPNGLRLPERPKGDESALPPRNPTPQLHTVPFIPEYITVHLGSPTDISARNVTVTFQDYIKNVASSEIYPTWPEESIRANILAQISFALNRVFTEWYRSRGYDFDITNTTAFDQYFVEGRNIFSNISEIVDEIFNVYIRKPGNEEPFFAQFCNGTTSLCDGLSQWGTVTLANDGLSADGILEYYYGDIELTESTNIQGPFESYPGNPLRVGTEGPSVRTIQEQLNRIAINYPSIPFIEVDGVFGEATERSVEQFQRIFNLIPDGIVGKATWYAISRVYVAVKDLSELTSEGERADYASQEFPGVLRLGMRGVEILELQLYLATIALYNNEVRTVALDGVFGGGTLDSVISFQRAYGLQSDGVVGEMTWRRLVEVYNGIKENVNVPTVDGGMGGGQVNSEKAVEEVLEVSLGTPPEATPTVVEIIPEKHETPPEPQRKVHTLPLETKLLSRDEPFERPLRVGSVGSDVREMKNALIEKGYLENNAAGGDLFGISTRRAVERIQHDAGLPMTGRVDEETWREIFR